MDRTTVRVTVHVELSPGAAFEILVDELASALAELGMQLEPGVAGRLVEHDFEVGRIVAWEPGERILLSWRQADWQEDESTEVELDFEQVEGGTRITLEHRGWGHLLGDRAGELVGWFAGEVTAPVLHATAPVRLGDWLTDRLARRPSGGHARAGYRDPLYHRPNFAVLLKLLALAPDDYLLEVGCGGGALLHDVLESGCRAAAIDHSPEMVQVAREVNTDAIAEGRLDVVESGADKLPFAGETFTCAVMTNVLGFLPDPVGALAEIRRVLVRGGRLALLGSDPACRGTIAAPEPMASRLRFYSDEELDQLGRDAGFDEVRVERHELEPYARAAGVPEEDLPFFAGPGTPFLVARKG